MAVEEHAMTRIIDALFDGKVFRPDSPPDIEPNTRCKLTVEENPDESHPETAWEVLRRLTGTVEMPEDWSAEHDHYLYGSPKRSERK